MKTIYSFAAKKRLLLSLLLAACTLTVFATEGALKGRFTVNKYGLQVHFSQGNLQYQAAPTPTWRFAEHQYDFVGNDTQGNVYDENDVKCNNALIADDYTGWIDLFGWGTGANPTLTDQSTSPYEVFVDWGTNPISNGGNEPNLWRSLHYTEWAYIFFHRPDAHTLFAFGSVDGFKGIIVLPDDWTLPEGASFTASTTVGMTFNGSDFVDTKSNDHFLDNTYSLEQWQTMEDNGAVFLPLAGERDGTQVGMSLLSYWASGLQSGWGSNVTICSDGTCFVPVNTLWRNYGLSIRLAEEVIPEVGHTFTVVYGENTLQLKVTKGAPDFEVAVCASGHTIIEGSDLLIPDEVVYCGKAWTIRSIEGNPQFPGAKTITLPSTLNQEVNWGGELSDLSSLEAFIVPMENPIYSEAYGVLYSKDKTKLIRCPAKRQFPSGRFPSGLKQLGSNYGAAFYGCQGISDLVIPKTVTDLGHATFRKSSLKSIYIPRSVTVIHNSTFEDCSQLEKVDFEDATAVTVAGWDAFNNSKIMTDQPEGVRVIDSIAIRFKGLVPDSLVIPEGVVNIAYDFYGSSRQGAENLKAIVLPSTLKISNEEPFSASETEKFQNLSTIICKAAEAPSISGDRFRLYSEQPVRLVVPCGKADEYMAASKFIDPFSIVEDGFVFDVALTQTEGGVISFRRTEECSGIELTATPAEGYRFVKWSDENTDAVRTLLVEGDVAFSAVFESTEGVDQTTNVQRLTTDKVLRNGNLYIRRNGRTYTATGAEMK
ncbi:MAG: leucine-rich repeat domain-containing protein [Paludibacteraceae bacterium]|nr:leucine-rich repeat domain-containing protein [Paludibacteraceae bacterium]